MQKGPYNPPYNLDDETLDVIDDVPIIQKKKGYRFTTDSILLAKLSSPKRHAKVLELGTGCGIVSLLLAKQDPSLNISAIEIQKEMAGLAERNVLLNDMRHCISVLNEDIKKLPQILPPSRFDYIVTNPPYRSLSSGRTSPHIGKALSRKEFAVTITDILKASQHLLKVRGRLSLIYIAERLVDLFSEMRHFRIEPKKLTCILNRREGEFHIAWIEGVREGRPGLRRKMLHVR